DFGASPRAGLSCAAFAVGSAAFCPAAGVRSAEPCAGAGSAAAPAAGADEPCAGVPGACEGCVGDDCDGRFSGAGFCSEAVPARGAGRRPARALGLGGRGAEPGPVAVGRGALYALVLALRRAFAAMVYAPAVPQRAEAILANPFYQTISSSFSGTQEYMAME